MPLDHDGKIRMDCSSPFAMANLVKLKDAYDISFGNDTDADRHGIVTRSRGCSIPITFLLSASIISSSIGRPSDATSPSGRRS